MKRFLSVIPACLIFAVAVSCTPADGDPKRTTELNTMIETQSETLTEQPSPSIPETPVDPPAPSKGLKTAESFSGFGGGNAWDWMN